jgi:hypothetical protein
MRCILLIASAVLLVASAAFAADRSYRSKNHFSMRVPEGWRRIDDATLRRTAKLTASALGSSAPSYEAAFEHEDADESFEYPYVLVQFVSGSTSGAYRNLENELMKGVEDADKKHGAKLNEVIGEHAFERPIVDRAKNRVWMNMRANTPTDGVVIGMMAMHLGSKGVAQITLYAHEQDAEQGRHDLQAMSDSVKFEDGYGFGERSFFEGWMGKALIGGLIGLVVGIVRAIAKSRKKPMEYAPAPRPFEEPMTPSPFGRTPAPKRVPVESYGKDPDVRR